MFLACLSSLCICRCCTNSYDPCSCAVLSSTVLTLTLKCILYLCIKYCPWFCHAASAGPSCAFSIVQPRYSDLFWAVRSVLVSVLLVHSYECNTIDNLVPLVLSFSLLYHMYYFPSLTLEYCSLPCAC